jgi:hypothetical protein
MKTNYSLQIDLQTGTIQILGKRYSNLNCEIAELKNLKNELITSLMKNEFPKSYTLNESVLNIPAFDRQHFENRWVLKCEILKKNVQNLIKQKYGS